MKTTEVGGGGGGNYPTLYIRPQHRIDYRSLRTPTHNGTENQPYTDNEVQEESRTNSEVEESSQEAENPQSHFCYRLSGTDCHLDSQYPRACSRNEMTMMREMLGQFELDVWL